VAKTGDCKLATGRGAAWRLIGGTLGATPTKTQTFTASGSSTGQEVSMVATVACTRGHFGGTLSSLELGGRVALRRTPGASRL
jgi:hypothetical protein